VIFHLLKLVWHRKRTNALVMAEILVSFLIVFAVVTMAVSLLLRWNAPLGFDWQNVWMIEVNEPLPMEQASTRSAGAPFDPARPDPRVPDQEAESSAASAATAERLIRELKMFPEVEAVAADAMTPYSDNAWIAALPMGGRRIDLSADNATDDYARVFRIRPLAGRWFSREDDGQNYVPIVVDANAARAMFGDAPAAGQRFSSEHLSIGTTAPRQYRVVGVVPVQRKDGEFSDTNTNTVYFRGSFINPTPPDLRRIVIRVRPGTPARFEAELNDRLRRLGAVSFTIKRLEDMRRLSLKLRFVPVAVLTVVALFLIAMVTLGLTGVMWQTITRRMREIGLRRAVGASGASVRRQVLGEVALLSTLSVVVGTAIVVQLPLLGLFRLVTPAEFAAGFAAALVVIYTITLACGAYPSWLASSVQPAEALRYE
jgi:putative ABC transport system permease protein